MTDEEKKAIEIQDSISILENTDLDINNIYSVDLRTYNVAVKTVLNLIEKQSKEIEYQKLKRENQRLELEANIEEYVKALTEWVNGERVSIHCVHKDKIKAKIEEVDENGYWDFLEKRDEEKCKDILQSLLEKE